LTWYDVIVVAPPTVPEPEEPPGWREMVAFSWARRDRLSPRNLEFIEGMRSWSKDVSAKQFDWIANIYDRLNDGGGR
jgi:hypothetical protein